MSEGKRSTVIKEATSAYQPLSMGHQKTRTQPTVSTKEKIIYFDVNIYDMSDPDEPEAVEELQAGKMYTLAITCDEGRSSIKKNLMQDGKPIAGNFSLVLSYFYNDVSVTTPITPAKEVFSFQDIFDDQFTYELTLPAEFPSCNITIVLKVKTPQRRLPMTVARYTLPVCGLQPPSQLDIFKVSRINQQLPEKTAILLAETISQQPAYKQCIRLRGWSEAGQQLDDTLSMHGIRSVEELKRYRYERKKAKAAPDEILNILTNFSRNNSLQLLRWLNMLFLAYQEQFNLVIVDLTDEELPWELLQLERERYLGVCARVVRWLPTQYFTAQRVLSVEPRSHAGQVISYLTEELGPAWIQDEQYALQCLEGTPYPTLAELRERLTDSLESVGLIYIGCHGIEGRSLSRLQQNVPELSSIMLEGIYACETPRLTVFINACESARTIKKSPDDNSNFADTFLAYCASGFIGTLARVDVQTASMIARQILLSALQPGGVQIAEKLRQLRKNELAQLEKLKQGASAGKDDYYRVIDTFMYVYYGNPLAYLQLHEKKDVGA